MDDLRVFPEACGYGSQARDWSDANLVFITNLNDSGAGSLRAAMMGTGKRIAIFRVSGTIQLASIILMSPPNGDLYLAGQTAPGQGIQVIGPTATSGHLLRLRGDANGPIDNAVIRNVSWRGQKTASASGDVIAIQTATNIVIANNSAAFSSDEVLGMSALDCNYPQWSGGIQNNILIFKNLFAVRQTPRTRGE